MTSLDQALDAFEAAATLREAREALRPLDGQAGISRGYCNRVVASFGGPSKKSILLASRWQIVVRLGDEPQFAYRARAIGEWLKGSYLAAARSFQEAGRRASNEVERRSLQLGAIDALARAGHVNRAVTLGKRLAKELEGLGAQKEAGRALLNVGNALTQADRHREAASAFKRSSELLANASLPDDLASALIGLSTSELALGQFENSEEHAEQAQTIFDSLAKGEFADLARVNIALLRLLSGRTGDALSLLDDLRERLTSDREGARLDELIGDTFFELNRIEESRASYLAAKAESARSINPRQANALFGLARTGILLDDPTAWRNLKNAKRAYERIGNNTMLAECHLLLCERWAIKNSWGNVEKEAQTAAEISRHQGANRTLARALLQIGEARFQQGKPFREDAAIRRIIQKHQFIGLKWRASYLQARLAPESQRTRLYRRMFREILESRLLANTALGRATFLDDKQEALRAYLEFLMARGRSGWRQEVLSVIAQSRSAALLDEILATRADTTLAEELQELRREFNLASETEGPGSGARLASARRAVTAQMSAKWIRAQSKAQLTASNTGKIDSEACVFLETADRYHALESGRYYRFELGPANLRRILARLAFELDGPLVDPGSDARPVLKLLDELTRIFAGPARKAISPDGLLWRVPWQIVGQTDEETVLLPSPAFGSKARVWRLPIEPKVCIWAGAGLEFVEQEVEEIKARFPHARVVRTAGQVRASLDNSYDLIHVAAHAHYLPDNPMFSQIEFSDGTISAAEIAASRLRVGCAALLACNSGKLSTRSPSEPDGLVRAFLARSAEVAIASSWPLNDQAACLLSEHLYELLGSGKTIAESVQKSRQFVRGRFEHPFYWGAPVLFGGYGITSEIAEVLA